MKNKVFVFILSIFMLFSCNKTNSTEKKETALIEIRLEKCTIIYGQQFKWGFSPNKIQIKTTIISQSTDTTLFVASGQRFHEPFLKSQIVSIMDKDTIRLHPGFWENTYISHVIFPNDSIPETFTYVTSDYMDNFFLGKRENREKALKVDKILIKELLNQDLIYIINKEDYENYALLLGRKIEDFPLPEVYFTKSKDFEITVSTKDFY